MSNNLLKENPDLRECLALERTTLANERTFLAYVRTAIMLFVTGVTIFKVFPAILLVFIGGWTAIGVSIILFFAGLRKYLRRFKSFEILGDNCSIYDIEKK